MSDSQILQRLTELRQRLEHQRDLAHHHLNEAEERVKAVVTTLDLLREDGIKNKAEAIPAQSELVTELRGKRTQLQALIAIARINNGKLFTRDAKRLLQQAGLMKPTKNASNILYNVINRSERFRHIGAGEYELIESSLRPVTAKRSALQLIADAALFPSKPVQ
jgi:hypothetical protein